ncbi:cathepsin K-like [Anguilla rostrata]|uniref:cathepsin K-like n=1 Tax=Anguilla rostrata TaxID=7938 RepID=UPI0030D03ED6
MHALQNFFLLVLGIISHASSHLNLTLNGQWKDWKDLHNKEYGSQEEEEQRRSVWEKNTLLIEAHNLEYEQGMHSYQLGMNHMGDMTAEEVAEKMTGLVVPQARETNNTFALDDIPTKLPNAIDYRILGFVTPVINQGSCLSCWAISAAGALEGQLMRSRRKLVPLSPQNLVDCVRSNYGCKGGYMTNAYKYAMKKGISSERKYPYMGVEQKCAYDRSNRVAQIWYFMELPAGNERVLQAVVAVHGPVSVGIQARSPSFIFYKSGVYYDPKCSGEYLNHAVLVVGYGVTPTCKKFWIVKNSWGQTWGDGGYILMARNSRNLCGIANLASIPIM